MPDKRETILKKKLKAKACMFLSLPENQVLKNLLSINLKCQSTSLNIPYFKCF